MEEVEELAVFTLFNDDLGQLFVLGKDLRQILLGQRVRQLWIGDDRLNGNLLKALVKEMQDVIGEVLVVFGEGAADIVLSVAALLNQLLELGQDDVVAAASVHAEAHAVVDLFSAVEREDDVVHFLVDVVDLVVGQQHTVGGDGEAEVFVVFLLLGAGVLDNLLDDIKSHERFAAEEVHLQVVAVAGIFEQIVDRLFAHLRGHQLALAAKIAGGGKAVGAAQVAVVRDVQAHGLDRRGDHHVCKLLIVVRREELAIVVHLVDFAVGFLQLIAAKASFQRRKNCRRICLFQLFCNFAVKGARQKFRVQQLDHIIYHFVDDMDRPAVDIHDDVVSI